MRVYNNLLTAGADVPGKVAIEYGDAEVTYGDLADRALRIAGALRDLGAAPGEAIALRLPNIPEFVGALYGAFINGNVVVPLNVLLKPGEMKFQLEDSGVRLVIVTAGLLEDLERAAAMMDRPPAIVVVGDSNAHPTYEALLETPPLADPYPATDDTHLLTLYTSGTTGKPKGAVITNRNLRRQLEMADTAFLIDDTTKYLTVLPLFHVFGLNAILNQAIRKRGTVLLQPRFDAPEAVRALAELGVTDFAGVPTMYFQILKETEGRQVAFPDLRFCVSGGAPMPVEVLKQFEARFGATIYEGYGLTETTVCVTCNRKGPGGRRIGSIGLPLDGLEMKVFDEDDREIPDGDLGEIVVRGPNVMRGYHNQPEATAEAMRGGWFHTGDLGRRDADGFFYVVDRKKDMILKGGFNIYPREIEEVIYEFPQVSEAAAVGLPDAAKGESIHAVVAFKPGQAIETEAIQRRVEEVLAKYKHPQAWHVWDELPKGPTNKILKREIRRKLEEAAVESER